MKVIFLILLISASSFSAGAALVSDQSNLRDRLQAGGAGAISLLQTITAGRSGYLDQLHLFGYTTSAEQKVLLEILSVEANGDPNLNDVLVSMEIDAPANSGGPSDTWATIPHVIDMSFYDLFFNVGEMFAFSISSIDGGLNWGFNYGDAGYDGGVGYVATSVNEDNTPLVIQEANYFNEPNNDWLFETFVRTPDNGVSVPEPSAIALMLIGLGCAARRFVKAR